MHFNRSESLQVPRYHQSASSTSFIYKSTHLNELVVCHVSTVKRLLVIHKSWQFSLLNLLATQHQNSRGKDTLYNRFCT